MRKKLKVLITFDLPKPPRSGDDFLKDLTLEDRTAEHDVYWALKRLGHDVKLLGIYDDMIPLVQEIQKNRPDIIFNLMEVFRNEASLEGHVIATYEILGIPYTGSGPVGVMLSKNKGIAKKILSHHRIKTPEFQVIHRKDRVTASEGLKYPVIVKPLSEEASYGISKKSVVDNDKDFLERVQFIHESMGQDLIAEEFVVGRELYVSLLGRDRPKVFPPREIIFKEIPDEESKFATFKAKWDDEYRKRWGIENRFATGLSASILEKIEKTCKRVFKRLYMKGYARIDLRLTPENEVVVLEANPNPFIAKEEDFALSAKKGGMDYQDLIQAILNEGLAG
ncbi:MAG: ATP-grasp domain-containing protein [bacterium]|nr:ATP-grasp domain-containing protein [bacterium]